MRKVTKIGNEAPSVKLIMFIYSQWPLLVRVWTGGGGGVNDIRGGRLKHVRGQTRYGECQRRWSQLISKMGLRSLVKLWAHLRYLSRFMTLH